MNGLPARHVISSFVVLLAIQIVTSMVALTLFVRMSPAIERILEDNVTTLEAQEQMLMVLTRPGPTQESERRAFAEALARAAGNRTEAEEGEPLAVLRATADAALRGDPGARERAVHALADLGRINRQAAQRADAVAQRLGAAGGWVVALLGLIGMGVSFYSLDRARRRVLAPLTEMAQVARAYQAGDLRRRCAPMAAASEETKQVMRVMNQILDAVESHGAGVRRSRPPA